MPELTRPWLLAAIVVVAVLVRMVWGGRGGIGLTVDVPPTTRAWSGVPSLLRAGVLTALGVALAGPVRTVVVPPPPAEGVAIVAVLDVSESMRARLPGGGSRLETAVAELRRFATEREGDLLGLVLFGGDVLTRVPPVMDRRPLLAALEEAPGTDLGDGTALGTALGVATNRLRAVEVRSRVVVLLTDGEHNAGPMDPVTAARAAAAFDVRVHALWAGAAPGALADVTRITGGRLFPVTDAASLDRAYREIDALERVPLPVASRRDRRPVHASFLWLGLVLLLGEVVVRAGRWGVIP